MHWEIQLCVIHMGTSTTFQAGVPDCPLQGGLGALGTQGQQGTWSLEGPSRQKAECRVHGGGKFSFKNSST